MSKIKYRVNDHSRVLLADMLPYETPFIFSNIGFFKWYVRYQNGDIQSDSKSFLERLALSPATGQTIPYNYPINRTSGGTLQLSVIHPKSQARFVTFYRRYETLITNQCLKSRYSIRYPKNRHAEVIRLQDPNHRKPRPGDPVDVEAEDFDVEQLYPHTYFVYGGYNLLYKFFESTLFLRMEKRFSHMIAFDLSKCFFNIYTHTIAWAVKDKDFAKKNKNARTFEKEFDEAMQCANYKETNGIPVGPEISRIFAEIILQDVDRRVDVILMDQGRKYNDDYAVVRYVDDYFIFTHDPREGNYIKGIFEAELLKYKLFVNDSKTQGFTLPYLSPGGYVKSTAAQEIRKLFKTLFSSNESSTVANPINRPNHVAKNVVKQIKEASMIGGATISIAASRVLFQIRDELEDYLGQDHEKISREYDGSKIVNIFEILIEIASFFVCHAYKAQSIVAFSHVVLIIREEMTHYNISAIENVQTRLIEEFNQIFLSTPNADPFSIERLNSLLLIREVNAAALFTDKRFSEIFYEVEKEKGGRWNDLFSDEGPGYFSVIVVLYCLGDRSQYADILKKLQDVLLRKFRDTDDVWSDTQRSLLLLDLLACPYLSKTVKSEILRAATNEEYSEDKYRKIVAQVSRADWWAQWREINLQPLLQKRTLRPAYEA